MIINGIRILTLMAARQEYGEQMEMAGIKPEFIGVGPIEAAFHTTRILEKEILENKKPDIIFSVGSAGSGHLTQCELYQITKVSYRDMDASPFGFDKGVTPYVDYPAVFELPVLFSHIPTATLSTGAKVINRQGSTGTNFSDISADCVDMETYAVVRASHHYHIPVIGLRGISDGHENSKGIASWEEYLHIIDEKIARFYDTLHHDSSALVQFASDKS